MATSLTILRGVKLLWLAICNIEDKRTRQRAKERKKENDHSRGGCHLVEGAATSGWRQVLGVLAITYPERINPYLN